MVGLIETGSNGFSDEAIELLTVRPDDNRSAFLFTETPIWVLDYNPTWSTWCVVQRDVKTRCPIEFRPDRYRLDDFGNLFGTYTHGDRVYGVVARRSHLVFMDVDLVMGNINDRTTKTPRLAGNSQS